MGYYSEIMQELDLLPVDSSYYGNIKRGCTALFSSCHQYAVLYRTNEDIKEVKTILRNYMDGENLLKNHKKEVALKDSKQLDVTEKLYIEYFWKCYEKHYKTKTEKDFFDEVILPYINASDSRPELIKAVWEEIFSDKEVKGFEYKQLVKVIEKWISNYDNIKNFNILKLENLHRAMNILGESLNKPDICIEDSVEEILDTGVLEYIRDALRLKKYANCQFMAAAVTRALTDGEIKSYIPRKGNTSVFFNTKCEYNLFQLQDYIISLQDLYEYYFDIKTELEKNLY